MVQQQSLPATVRRRPRLAAAGTSLAVIAAAVGLGALVTVATAAQAVIPAPPAGFTLTWSDDFSGAAGSGATAANWKYEVGPGSNFGTGEIETMTNSTANVFHDGAGHLVIKALHSGTDPRQGWTSGRLVTQAANFGAPAGGVVRMEASIQQPDVTTANGAGYWPAFWMLGEGLRTGGSWPGIGEVDILEDINGRSSVFGTLHCGTNPGGPCNESSGIGSGERACAGCQTGYHKYAVEVDRSTSPEQLRWYLDGNLYFTLSANQVDATAWKNAVDHNFFMILNLAIGGGFPDAFGGGPNTATVSGASLNVDYVAVYNKGGGGGPIANIAQGKPTTSSSNENAGTPATGATDGNAGTRWASAFSDPQWLQVDLGQAYDVNRVVLNWEGAYGKAYQIQTSDDAVTWTTIQSTSTGDGGVDDLAVTGKGRYLRMLGTVRGTGWGYSLWEMSVSGTPATSTSALLSQGRPATASSVENAGTAAANAVDGNAGSRWASAFSDPQWLRVDLGSTHAVNRVVLTWEAAYGKAFQIQTSNDGTTWTNIYSTTTGSGGTQDLAVTGSGRYVQMIGTARGTGYGYSLWEFKVYGT